MIHRDYAPCDSNCDHEIKPGDRVRIGKLGVAWIFLGHPIGYTDPEWYQEGGCTCEASQDDWHAQTDPDCEAEYHGGYWTESEAYANTDRAVVVMVGDDSHSTYYMEDLKPIEELAYCHACGQIGCGHDGLEREGVQS